MNFIEWGLAFLHEDVNCSFGHDSGPIVNEFQAYCGEAPGTAWCADTASYMGHKAMVDAGETDTNPWFKTGSSQEMKRLAQEQGKFFTDPNHLLNCKGAIMVYTDHPDSAHGHIMPVAQRLTDADMNVTHVRTIEGNSDTQPHNAMASLVRSATEATEGRTIGFIDISDVPGCAYWS